MKRSSLHSALETIAREELGLRTLDIQGRDDLDFHDLHIGRIERALRRAYVDGCNATASRLFSNSTQGE